MVYNTHNACTETQFALRKYSTIKGCVYNLLNHALGIIK